MNGFELRRPSVVSLVLVAALLGLVACQGSSARNSPTPPATAAATAPARSTPVAAGPLTLTITSPADETVVTVPQVDVLGQAPADAVISVNDSMVVVGATGYFSTTVPLQPGPNEIDVLASDAEGNEASSQLIVTYDPPG